MLISTQNRLKRALSQASDYQEWMSAAQEYDRSKGLDRWRQKDSTRQYDNVSIRIRLDALQSLKARHDIRGLLYTLNEGIHGNMGGMGRPGLYGHALSGTKTLIENYIEEIVDTLQMLHDDASGEISEDEKLEFFRRASHCFGRSAFMMSGSGSLLFFHVGVIRALAEAKLLPTVLSGSSGGAIVGSIVATHTDKELLKLLQPEYFMQYVPKADEAQHRSRLAELEAAVQQFIPDVTFQQAFAKTGRAMNVSIAPAETHQTSRLMNSITSPSVLIRSAVMASAS
ncbi:MAG: patatin-like phospholipase family protein, partial [Congregibacter sp.]|nr:patatin-like phospholipase family protein [Congregibacter sp.]